jgi:GGDEF domain-containing protein
LGAPSVSAGIAIFPEHAETLSGTLRAANAALQQAKQSGRDRICLAEPAQSAP